MYELLSKRIKNADGEPEVFTYNSFPQAFRNQVFYILEDVLEPYSTYSENLWDIFEKKFCREKGLKGMGYGKLQNGYGKSSIEKYFKDCDDIDFLDAVMIGILVMSIRMLIQIASTASLRPRIKPESGERNFIIAFRMASVGNVCKSNLPRFYSIQLEYAHFRQTFDVLQ